jgi:hypothetical protein
MEFLHIVESYGYHNPCTSMSNVIRLRVTNQLQKLYIVAKKSHKNHRKGFTPLYCMIRGCNEFTVSLYEPKGIIT